MFGGGECFDLIANDVYTTVVRSVQFEDVVSEGGIGVAIVYLAGECEDRGSFTGARRAIEQEMRKFLIGEESFLLLARGTGKWVNVSWKTRYKHFVRRIC